MEKRKPLIVFGLIIIFTFLFYKQPIGLNLLIFEIILIVVTLLSQPQQKLNFIQKILIGIFLSGSISFVINFTLLAFIFNLISGVLLIAVLAQPEFKSIFYATPAGLNAIFPSAKLFLKQATVNTPLKSKPSLIYISVIPIFIVIFYVILYSASNPFFNSALNRTGIFISNIFNLDVNYLQIFLLLLTGLFLVCPFFYNNTYHYWADKEAGSEVELKRKRPNVKPPFKILGLLNEYRSGIILFTLLNLILFIVNILDIWNIWFNFEWNGQYLKQFVHEGTYMLIFSIMLSIGLILIYFRGNLNFYSQNNLLKWLAYFWLAQNAILAVSVAIRNVWYINYFALAYKRIGVIFFLAFTLILIFTVIIKVKQKKTFYYLLRVNSLSLFTVIFLMSLFNWDNIIAKYNLSNYDKSFVHWDFLAYLPNKTLHILSIPDDKIKKIELKQETLFRFNEKYISGDQYSDILERRKLNFINKWEKKGFLSWNLPEYMAYKRLDSK